MGKKTMIPVFIRVPPEHHQKLTAYAISEGRPLANLVRRIVTEWIDRQDEVRQTIERELPIEEARADALLRKARRHPK